MVRSKTLYLSMGLGDDSINEEVERLALVVACLHAFIPWQANWTRPLRVVNRRDNWVSELAYGGEPAYHLAKVPAFSQILSHCCTNTCGRSPVPSTWSWCQWKLRILYTNFKLNVYSAIRSHFRLTFGFFFTLKRHPYSQTWPRWTDVFKTWIIVWKISFLRKNLQWSALSEQSDPPNWSTNQPAPPGRDSEWNSKRHKSVN